MPTIQSKKYPDNVQYVDSETWQHFKRLGKDRNFKIIDDTDLQETVIPAPEVITEFAAAKEVIPEEIEPIKSREEIKAELDKLVDEGEIEPYNVRASTEKLLELLNNK